MNATDNTPAGGRSSVSSHLSGRLAVAFFACSGKWYPTVSVENTSFTELLQRLVRIETENPPGNEGPCAAFIHDWFERRDIDATVVEKPDPDRPQVAARVGDGDPTLVLNGHLDVVPIGRAHV